MWGKDLVNILEMLNDDYNALEHIFLLDLRAKILFNRDLPRIMQSNFLTSSRQSSY
jgi:hypothetical protein